MQFFNVRFLLFIRQVRSSQLEYKRSALRNRQLVVGLPSVGGGVCHYRQLVVVLESRWLVMQCRFTTGKRRKHKM